MTPLSYNRIIVPTSLRNRLLQRRLGRPVGGRAPQRDGGIGAAFERHRYMSLGRFDCGERQTSIGQGIRPAEHAGIDYPRVADRMRELCSAGSGAGLAVPDPPLLRITLPGMYWSGGSASGGSEDCGVGPWGISTPGGFNPPGGGYVGSLVEPQILIIRESHPSSKIRSRYWRGG
jgi:hypothetical protein